MRNFKTRIMFLVLCSVLTVNVSAVPILGVKSGDWIEYDFQETASAGGETIEFLSVVGTNVTIRVTVHWSASLEINQTGNMDLSSDDNFPYTVFFGARVYIVPSDLGSGASVYLGEFGNQTIAGEATGTFAGANRRLVYANFSQSGSMYTFYWDEQTGVLVEGTKSMFGTASQSVLATETNLWSADFVWWPWVIVIIIIVCSIVVSRKKIMQKLHGKPSATSDSVTRRILTLKKEMRN
jgi:hypothetical protein